MIGSPSLRDRENHIAMMILDACRASVAAVLDEVQAMGQRVEALEAKSHASVVVNGVVYVPVIPLLVGKFGVAIPQERYLPEGVPKRDQDGKKNGRTWNSIVGAEFKAIAEECGKKVDFENCLLRESAESSYPAWWYPEPWAIDTATKWIARNHRRPGRKEWFQNGT